jgi:hypothetical protein
VLLYSLGAVAGPLIASLAMGAAGPAGLFATIGATAMLATMFGLWRLLAADGVPEGDQMPFQSLPRTTAIAISGEDEAD